MYTYFVSFVSDGGYGNAILRTDTQIETLHFGQDIENWIKKITQEIEKNVGASITVMNYKLIN